MSDDIKTIFADGLHCDNQGLLAAMNNEPVRYMGRVYPPGEDVNIEFRDILLTGDLDGPKERIGRMLRISHCKFVRPYGARFPGVRTYRAIREDLDDAFFTFKKKTEGDRT